MGIVYNDIVDNFQSAYKAGHSCETALLQLIMIIFFCILEKYVGICGNALKLIKSYFSNRTQRVQIDDVLSDFANIICGVPQGSVLGPLTKNLFCIHIRLISQL